MNDQRTARELSFRRAGSGDAGHLAEMNARLIRDEGHRNPMTGPELVERMRDWLRGSYDAVLFEIDGAVAGYALYRLEPDHAYLRQFFVESACRRQGVGRTALQWLWRHAWPDAPCLRVHVLVANEAGIAFWRSVGFRDYYLTMEAEAPPRG